MTDAPEWEDAYHPQRILHSGNAPKGWSDEFRFAPYIRADIAAAREAELRAEVERLTQANREAAMQAISDGCQAQAAIKRALAAAAIFVAQGFLFGAGALLGLTFAAKLTMWLIGVSQP